MVRAEAAHAIRHPVASARSHRHPCATAGPRAASIDEALEATRKTDFDLAILDADLKGRSVSPVADALVARDKRFVFSGA